MKVRRVVTGTDREGRSRVKWDSEIETVSGRLGFSQSLMWVTKELPARLTEDDPGQWKIGTTVAGGSVFRIARYEPGVEKRMHRTDSIDYAVVLSGEIVMQMDEGEVLLKAGDVVVQRGTMHNWVNRGPESCVIAFILVATEGGQSTGW
jgi:mannose-6-phosphate isomerase-like protein (cupin superfamily)